MKKKPLYIILSAIWIALMVFLGVNFLFAGKGGEIIESENRTLALAPDFRPQNVFNGNISDDTESFLADHIFGRSMAIGFYNRLKDRASFATYEDSLAIQSGAKDALAGEKVSDEELAKMAEELRRQREAEIKAAETTAIPNVKPKSTKDIDSFDDWLGISINGEDYYYFSKDGILATASVLNRVANCLPKDGHVVFTMVPQSVAGNRYVAEPGKGGFVSTSEELVDAATNTKVRAVNSAEILGKGIEHGEYVYFRSDMHWTPYGTWLVYSEMLKMAGQKPAAWEDFNIQVEEPFLGTYYRDGPTLYMEQNPDRLDLVTPKFNVSWRRIDGVDSYHEIPLLDFDAMYNDRYTVYLGGPAGPWTYAACDNGIDRRALVICDSFGLGFVPQVLANYGQVHYLDCRYYDYWTVGYTVKEMIEHYNISDVYVVIGDLHAYDNEYILYQLSSQLGDQ
ncbi:MAG: DHHW family protein [Lachnospiraceae bacterium]|nr:DHHW family protein [Lachnospiraceae bacterium]